MSSAIDIWGPVPQHSVMYRKPPEVKAYYKRRARDMRALRKRGWTLERIGTTFKVTRQRVCQILGNNGAR